MSVLLVALGFFLSGFGFGWVGRGRFVLWKVNRRLDVAELKLREVR